MLKKLSKRVVSLFLALVMLLCAVPMTAMAAPNSDIPEEMLDNVYLDALSYTGYNVEAQKNDGSIFVKYGSRVDASIRSNITYDQGPSGLETIEDGSTISGKAPNIAKYEEYGLCCASYVSYVYYNYMPNVAGIDTSATPCPSNPRMAAAYYDQAQTWVAEGKARNITFFINSDGSGFTPAEEIPIGSLICYRSMTEDRIAHVAIYAGYYNGNHFVTHVGNERGPEFSVINNAYKGNSPQAVASITVPEFVEENGLIEVYKKDTDGNNLAGAVFVATSVADGSKQYIIGPTNASGYGVSTESIPYGDYIIKETVFPTNYRSYGQTEWRVTVSSANNGVATFWAVNEIIPGNCRIVKSSEDGEIAGIEFTLEGNGIRQTVKTGEDGSIQINDLKPGNYTVRETVAEKYEPQEVRSVTVVSGQTATVTFNNVLKRGSLKIVKTSEDGVVEGMQFKLTGTSLSGHAVEQFAVTDAQGVAVFEDVLITGHQAYTIEEVNTAERYIVPESQSAVIEWEKVTQLSFYNELKRGNLKVTKTSEDNIVKGMRFHLFGTSLSGVVVDEYATTDENGIAVFEDILVGEYYTIAEVSTPDRYVIPEKQDTIIRWDEVTGVTFENILKKWRADVFKVDRDIQKQEENNGNVSVEEYSLTSDEMVAQYGSPYGETQGDATLEGAVYGVYKNGELIDTYTTDKNGYFITDYYICGDNNEWTIKEIMPSTGYLLDETIYYVDAAPNNYRIELNTEYVDVYEDIIKGKFAIIKHSDDGSTKIETPEAGAEFEIYLKSARNYENAKETERAVIVCDENGFGETDWLPYGVYVVEQTKGWEGKELMPTFDVNISADGETYRYLINNATFEAEIEIVKKDKETGKVIPASGVGFKVRNTDTGEYVVQRVNYPTPVDIEVFYTDTTGKLMLPEALLYGNYEIIEQCTAFGYVLDGTPVAFKVDGSTDLVTVEKYNMPQKGTITVTKFGEVFASAKEIDGHWQPVYEVQGLEGAVYEVTAAEDVVTPDGTVRYKKGEVVATITTEKEGKATTEPLYLGRYEIRETKAPYGMVVNPDIVPVELVYAGQEIAVTSTSATFVNERQRAAIELVKTLEQDALFGIGMKDEISKIQFGLFAACDLTAADGALIPKDALMETASCDKDGNLVFTTDLPVDTKVYVKELATDSHYILSDNTYAITFDYAGQDVSTVKIAVNDGVDIENELIRGTIAGKKLDEDGFSICGALFGLFAEDETEFTEETAIMTCTSNEIGVFFFENVPYGRWIVREIKAAPAFVLNENSYVVTIAEDEELIEIVIENEFITGSVQTTKVDAEYPENKLTGAVFEVYVDVDRNQEFNAEIDLLVGELKETETGIYQMADLRYNGYFLHEKTAPAGFLQDEGYYYFAITTDEETVVVENQAGTGFVNQPIKGELELTKTDVADGRFLADAGFRIKDEAGNVVAEGYTDENGIAKFTLRYGKYTYEEFDAPDGYLLDTTPHAFEITEDGQIIKAAMTNEKVPVPEVPQTGDDSNMGFWIGLGAVALGGLVAIAVIGIKNKKEDDEA